MSPIKISGIIRWQKEKKWANGLLVHTLRLSSLVRSGKGGSICARTDRWRDEKEEKKK